MSINSIEFGGSDKLALDYIRKRGYCSYSSMCNVRDKRDPFTYSSVAQNFGHEFHSRFLEKKKIVTLSQPEEQILKKMICNLGDDPMIIKLMQDAEVEVEFREKVNGLVMYGRIDILNPYAVGDLKTTSCTSMRPFALSMDFLQAAIYKKVKKRKDFYYAGSCKVEPHHPMVFNANYHALRMKQAEDQLDYWSRYIKNRL